MTDRTPIPFSLELAEECERLWRQMTQNERSAVVETKRLAEVTLGREFREAPQPLPRIHD